MNDSTSTVSFETPLGRMAIRWTELGVSAVHLPQPRVPGVPVEEADRVPEAIRATIDGIRSVLAGAPADLRFVLLDQRAVEPFRRDVYAATREIPAGETRSYGEVAKAMGLERFDAARDVGAALARNPTPVIVPCHRVLAADGTLHGFSAPGGLETKRRMLELEGVPGFGQQALFG